MSKVDIHRGIVLGLNEMYEKKNLDYGDSFSLLRSKYPNAILIRLTDKLNRLERLMAGNEMQVKDESIEDTLLDLANYALMEVVEMRMEREALNEQCSFDR